MISAVILSAEQRSKYSFEMVAIIVNERLSCKVEKVEAIHVLSPSKYKFQ